MKRNEFAATAPVSCTRTDVTLFTVAYYSNMTRWQIELTTSNRSMLYSYDDWNTIPIVRTTRVDGYIDDERNRMRSGTVICTTPGVRYRASAPAVDQVTCSFRGQTILARASSCVVGRGFSRASKDMSDLRGHDSLLQHCRLSFGHLLPFAGRRRFLRAHGQARSASTFPTNGVRGGILRISNISI